MASRRAVLRATGAALAGGLAGCGGGGGGSETEAVETLPGRYPDVEAWLTSADVGAADETYTGAIIDRTGADTAEVSVGADGNGGNFAFAPSAVAVSTGTTVRWVWTGEGGAHNVQAEPGEQIGASDYEFSSGDPVSAEGTTFTRTLDTAGRALYHCEPHLSVGMKGVVVVR